MERRRCYLCAVLSALLTIAVLATAVLPTTVLAATKVSLNATDQTIQVGETYRLKLNNAKGTVKWKSSDKKVAEVNEKGKVKGLASGTATITAVYKKKNYTCTFTVEHPVEDDEMENKKLGPVNICYSKELSTKISEEPLTKGSKEIGTYIWTAKNSEASEILKLTIIYTAPQTMTYDFIEEQFAKEFTEESAKAKFEEMGYSDVKLKKMKKSSYKVLDGKALRASARISAKKGGEERQEDRVIYIFSKANYLFAFSGQALEGGSFSNVDKTIKEMLKTMIFL